MNNIQREYRRAKLDLENMYILKNITIPYNIKLEIADRFCKASDALRGVPVDMDRLERELNEGNNQ